MFDIGFSELILVVLVALAVLSPKDMQRLSRALGEWVGKSQAYLRDFKQNIQQAKNDVGSDQVDVFGEMTQVKNQVAEHLTEVKKTLLDQKKQIAESLQQAENNNPMVNLSFEDESQLKKPLSEQALLLARKDDPFADPHGLPPTYDELVVQVKSLNSRLMVLEKKFSLSPPLVKQDTSLVQPIQAINQKNLEAKDV
jgi:Sec-independent protein translocase protein TatA